MGGTAVEQFIDAYAVLGVRPDADEVEIKAAYRQLAAHHHPDVVSEDERQAATARMQRINVAYGLVAEASRRRQYDRVRALHRTQGTLVDAEELWMQLLRSAGTWVGRQRRQSRGGWYRAGYSIGRWMRG